MTQQQHCGSYELSWDDLLQQSDCVDILSELTQTKLQASNQFNTSKFQYSTLSKLVHETIQSVLQGSLTFQSIDQVICHIEQSFYSNYHKSPFQHDLLEDVSEGITLKNMAESSTIISKGSEDTIEQSNLNLSNSDRKISFTRIHSMTDAL